MPSRDRKKSAKSEPVTPTGKNLHSNLSYLHNMDSIYHSQAPWRRARGLQTTSTDWATSCLLWCETTHSLWQTGTSPPRWSTRPRPPRETRRLPPQETRRRPRRESRRGANESSLTAYLRIRPYVDSRQVGLFFTKLWMASLSSWADSGWKQSRMLFGGK